MVRNGTAERSDMGTLSLGGYRPSRTWFRSDCDRPAGPPSAPELEQGYGWRTGHRAGALSVLFMLATGTGVAGTAASAYTRSPKTQISRSPRWGVASGIIPRPLI